MNDAGTSRFISVRDFARSAGISRSRVKDLYTVTVDGRLQVPRFMLDSDLDSELDLASDLDIIGVYDIGVYDQDSHPSGSHAAPLHTDASFPEPSSPESSSATVDVEVNEQAVDEWQITEFHATGEHTAALQDEEPDTDRDELQVEEPEPDGDLPHDEESEPDGDMLQDEGSEANRDMLQDEGPEADRDMLQVDATGPVEDSLPEDTEPTDVPSDETARLDRTDSESELDPIERLSKRIRQTQSQIQAGPYTRFLARLFDFALFFSLPTYGFALSVNTLNTTLLPLQPLILAAALLIVCVLSALILDAFCYLISGNTPGKALLALRVSDSAGEPLPFTDYLLRNFNVLAQGLAFLILPFTLLALWMQFRRVNAGLPASYDAKRATIVEDDISGISGKLIFSVSLVVLLLVAISGVTLLWDSVV